MSDGKELYICSVCQAYFCPSCLKAVQNYSACPAARLLGVGEHELKYLKILPPKPILLNGQSIQYGNSTQSTVKIMPRKSVKVIDAEKKKKQKTSKDNKK